MLPLRIPNRRLRGRSAQGNVTMIPTNQPKCPKCESEWTVPLNEEGARACIACVTFFKGSEILED